MVSIDIAYVAVKILGRPQAVFLHYFSRMLFKEPRYESKCIYDVYISDIHKHMIYVPSVKLV